MVSSRHFCKFHLSSSIARSSDVFLSREKFSPPEDFSNFRKYNRILGGEKGNHLEGAISDDSELFSSLPTILAVLTYFSRQKFSRSRDFHNFLKYDYIFIGKKGNGLEWSDPDDSELFSSLPLLLVVLVYFSRTKNFHSGKFYNLLKYYYIFTGKKGNRLSQLYPDDSPSLISLPLLLAVLTYFSRQKLFKVERFSQLSQIPGYFHRKKGQWSKRACSGRFRKYQLSASSARGSDIFLSTENFSCRNFLQLTQILLYFHRKNGQSLSMTPSRRSPKS